MRCAFVLPEYKELLITLDCFDVEKFFIIFDFDEFVELLDMIEIFDVTQL